MDFSIKSFGNMVNTSIKMSNLRQVYKLYSRRLEKREIAGRLGSSRNTVEAYLNIIALKGISTHDAHKLSALELMGTSKKILPRMVMGLVRWKA